MFKIDREKLNNLFNALSDKAILDIEQSLNAAAPDAKIDVLGILEEKLFNGMREEILDEVISDIRKIDPKFYEDPNPVAFHPYPQVNRGDSSSDHEIGFVDLRKRNPHSDIVKDILADSKVCYIGFGGIEESAILLARNGVGNFKLIDHDHFEATNGCRQTLCYSDTLKQNKATVGGQFIKKINKDANVEVVTELCTADNIADLIADADVVIDGTGDTDLRNSLHHAAGKHNKPIMTWSWAGYEGQCMIFMPHDPLYYDIFAYSPPGNSRGFDAAGTAMLNAHVAKDVLSLLVTLKGEKALSPICSYPNLMTFSLMRQTPAIVRNVDRIKDRHDNNPPAFQPK